MPPDESQEAAHPWREHAATYRAKEVQTLARWISTNASGSVIGLNGAGKSDLIGFLCYRPDVLASQLMSNAQPVTLLPLDLNGLPESSLSALFRVILRTFHEHKERFGADTHGFITDRYLETRAAVDPFVSQSALRELLLHLQRRRHRIVFALDRFDAFCTMLAPEMGDALRGLRDGFKDTLSYIASMRQGLAYVADPELMGDLYRLLDTQLCYIGPMTQADTHDTVLRRMSVSEHQPTAAEHETVWRLSGGYPSLVLAVCRWWLGAEAPVPLDEWRDRLLTEPAVQNRLADIWQGLTQEEQLVLAEVHKSAMLDRSGQAAVGRTHVEVLTNLSAKGLCHQSDDGWRIFSELFAEYVAREGGHSRGRICLEPNAKLLYHGTTPIEGLAPKERAVLEYLVVRPHLRHSYTDIIVAAWSEEERYHGVSNESLYQVVRQLRQKIEPNPSRPVYVVNWRGKPEGGYQFFPEGRPG